MIIVSYRSAPLTVACLRSIVPERATCGARVEALVVDNASGDAPEIEAALSDPTLGSWARLLIAPRNGGFAYGNNLAFREAYASGAPPDYFHLLNPDTLMRPGAIRELVAFLRSHPRAGIAGSGIETPEGAHWATAFRFPGLLSEIEFGLEWGVATRLLERYRVPRAMRDVAETVDWVQGSSMMVRRELLEDIGGLDERYFLYYEETDFCLRAAKADWQCWYVPDSRVMHIAGQSTGVNERNAPPRRFPQYWFESRRRYFVKNHGLGKAVAIDAGAIVAHGLGSLKRFVQGRRLERNPSFLADFLVNTSIRPRNRTLEAQQVFSPRSGRDSD